MLIPLAISARGKCDISRGVSGRHGKEMSLVGNGMTIAMRVAV